LNITVALVEYKTPFARRIEGTCSRYLKSIQPSEDVLVWLKKGSLIFPKNLQEPIIMIGPGSFLLFYFYIYINI